MDGNGDWNVNGNWTTPSIFPNGQDAEAIFGTVITSNRSITLGEDITVGRIEFEDNNNYRILSGNTLFFAVSSGNGEILVNNGGGSANGSHRIDATIQLDNSLSITQQSTAIFNIAGNITGTGAISMDAPTAGRIVNFNANNNDYTGGTFINSGTFRYSGQACITPLSTVEIGNGGGVDAILFINRGMGSSSQFLPNINPDGSLVQGGNRITRVSGITGTGTFEFNSINGNLIGTLDGAGDTTFDGQIIGGRFQIGNEPNAGSRWLKSGNSMLTLTGNSSYISRTFIGSGSTIRAESNNALGSSDNRSSVLIFSGGVLELNGGISIDKRILLNGSGISGSGALRNISGNNENAGIVEIGWSASNVTPSDAIISVDADMLTLSGSVQGNNNLTKSGPGSLIYSGPVSNTLSGTTTLSQGAIRLNKTLTSAINGPINIPTGQVVYDQPDQIGTSVLVTLNGGVLDMNGQDDTIGSLEFLSGTLNQGGGTLGFASTSNALTLRNVSIPGNIAFTGASGGNLLFDNTNGGFATIEGDIDLGGQSRNFILDNSAASSQLVVEGSISNGSIVKSGTGRLLLEGINSYSGITQIDEGFCSINGSLADGTVIVAAGGALEGNGILGTGLMSITNSGLVSPGNSIDTLTINGDYIQTATGSLLIEILNESNFDQLIVNSGAVSLDGTLEVDILPGSNLSGTSEFVIIDNTMGLGVTGQFANIFLQNPLFMANAIYNADTVVLSITVLDDFIDQNLPRYPNLTAMNFQYIDQAQVLLSQRFFELQRRLYCKKQKYCRSPCKAHNRLRYNTPVFQLYAGPKGAITSSYTHDRQARSSTDGLGLVVGGEIIMKRYAAGTSFIYEKMNTQVTKDWGTMKTNRYVGNFYQTLSLFDVCRQSLHVNHSIGFALNYQNMKRITFGEELLSDLEGYDIYTAADCNYLHFFEQIGFSAFGGWSYYHTSIDKYEEKGSALLRLTFDQQNSDSLRSRLGGGWFREVVGSSWVFTPYVGLEWQREYLDRNRNLEAFNELTMQRTKLGMHRAGRDFYFFSLSFELSRPSSLSAKTSYDISWNKERISNYLYFLLNYKY